VARQINKRDLGPILAAAQAWIEGCLSADGSMFSSQNLWTRELVAEVRRAFVDHPDFGEDDFMTKLKGQMKPASKLAQMLMAEMLWALLLFPSNMKARTKRQQIRDVWGLSGSTLSDQLHLLSDSVLVGVGSGGPGFNNYRPEELEYLVELVGDLKSRSISERQQIFGSYEAFTAWIDAVPRKGSRQFRHMLRYFAFPNRVERMSSNNDRRRILDAFGRAPAKLTKDWTDQQLDDALFQLRAEREKAAGSMSVIDFYEPPLRDQWLRAAKVTTPTGDATIVVPLDEEEDEIAAGKSAGAKSSDARESIKTQAMLATIGAAMGFSIWIPPNDRARVATLVSDETRQKFLDKLPLNYDQNTLGTVSQIDVIWINKQSIVRAFEVEHTTAVYSGLLRMADLLALQPNMKIHLHIVAPDERREKVFREMQRPVFTYLDAGPLARTCTFLSYESVTALSQLSSLSHMQHTVIDDYEERAEESDT
jgi:hypothetical protein